MFARGRPGFLAASTPLHWPLMAGVTVQLGQTALIDPLTIGLAVAALVLRWRTRLNFAWCIAAAGLIGVARTVAGLAVPVADFSVR